jgi:uncharacterized protein (TIGR01615 family)
MYPNVFYLGEYEYIDVIMEGDKFHTDINFISEFEIAQSTKAYKAILQSLQIRIRNLSRCL